MPGRFGRALKFGARVGIGGAVAGPVGAVGAGFGPGAVRAGRNIGRATKRQTDAIAAKTIAMHKASRFRNNRAIGFAARHPVAMALGPGYGAMSGYLGLPNGRATSRRNQNDPYLRRVRAAAAARGSSLPGHSLGGMTGY